MSDELSFHLLFEWAQDAFFVVNREDGQILEANGRAGEWTGFSRDRLAGTPFLDLFSGEDRVPLQSFLFSPTTDAEGAALDVFLQREGKAALPCQLRARPARRRGAPVLVIVLRDISGRVKALEEVFLRDEAIASLACGVTIADARLPDLPLIYVNRGFERVTGFSADEAVGRNCRFLQVDDRDQEQLDHLRRALQQGEPCDVRLRNYRKDGTLFWNELHISPVRAQAGELTHFVGIQIDVTNRVLAESRLEASERRYRLLADNMEDVVLCLSPEGAIHYASPSSVRLFGYPPEELQTMRFSRLLRAPDEPAASQRWQEMLVGEASAVSTFEARRKDGSFVWVEATKSYPAPEAGEILGQIIIAVRDVTWRIRADEEIRCALEKEKQLHRIKTSFIRMVSHEFRTPITGISASAGFLKEYGDSVPPEKRQRHFRNIETALQRMNELLDDVLFVNRSEAGKVPFHPRPVEILSYCEGVIENLGVIHGDRSVDFNASLPDQTTFLLDAALLNQILFNLLSNAFKYSPRGEPVRLDVKAENGWLTLSVEDKGIGIPEEARGHLFEPFFRAANVGTVQGTGLGLYIAKRSAELHAGSVRFCPNGEKGTRIEVVLPVEPFHSGKK